MNPEIQKRREAFYLGVEIGVLLTVLIGSIAALVIGVMQ